MSEPVNSISTTVHDRSIGDIIAELRTLSAEQVAQILKHQQDHGVRFGDAAVALGLANADDINYALSQQFHYPYAPHELNQLSAELVVLGQSFGEQAERFRALRSQIIMRYFGEPGSEPRALAVVSADHGDGKSFVAGNLAVSLAQVGGKTLLIDANLRKPRQHEIFKLEGSAGLSNILAGRAEAAAVRPIAAVPGLCVLPVGVTPPNPVELVERPAFGLLLRELVSKFDHVIVDTPAALSGSDASVIAARCGGALLLARKNHSRLAELHALTESLRQSSAKLVGAVVNDF
jgi:protein-tyrosine kinase